MSWNDLPATYLANLNALVLRDHCERNSTSHFWDPFYSYCKLMILTTTSLVHISLKCADDTVLYLAGQDISEIENQLTSEMQVVTKWLDENDLIINLNKAKTESMLLRTS